MKKPTSDQVKKKLNEIERKMTDLELRAPNAKWLKTNKRYKELKANKELFNKKLKILQETEPIRISFPNWPGKKDIIIKPTKKDRM